MSYIIGKPCEATCDTACVGVCPVDCIHGPIDIDGSGAEVKTEARSASTEEFGGGLEAFLLTYADMITLLLVIFVMMYTASNIDQEKFAEAKHSGFRYRVGERIVAPVFS